MEETQPINIGSGQDLSAIANHPKKVSFDATEETTDIDDVAQTSNTASKLSLQNYDDPEMRQKHKRLIKMLRGYANSSFGKRGVLSEYEFDIDSLRALSVEALENLLEDVKFSVGMSNSATFSVDMFKMGFYGIETAITASGMADLTGFTHAMLTMPNMNDYL